MTATMSKTFASGLLSGADMEAAQQASRALARFGSKEGIHVEAKDDGQACQSFVLPAAAVRLLTEMLTLLAQGRSVAVMPDDAELTTQQTADMLNVSRPHVVKLLEENALPHHKVGTHRRVLLRDLIAYQSRRAVGARAALDELTRQAQELDMGY